MINLTDTEIDIIKLCKGHYKTSYPFKETWINTFKPLFKKIYGWNPDEDNNMYDYKQCLFQILLHICFSKCI